MTARTRPAAAAPRTPVSGAAAAVPHGTPPSDRAVHWLALVGLPLLTCTLYASAFDAPFVYDDYTSVYFQGALRSLWPLSKFFYRNRGLTDLSYAINYAMSGEHPGSYHVLNLGLHAANGLLVYLLVLLTLRLPGLAARFRNGAAPIALVTAALFVAHPLQAEVAAYVASRSEALMAFFYLATVALYATQATLRRGWARNACIVALVLTTVAALASKESAATIPVALLLYDWCFIAGGRWRDIRSRWWVIALTVLPMAIGVPILLGRVTSFGEVTAGFELGAFGPGTYLLTQLGVILHYARLVLLPLGLCMDPEWPLARSPWSPGVIIPFVVLAVSLSVAVLFVRRQPLVTFAILWMLVVLAPTSSIVPIADVMQERRMYLALFGPLLLIATVLWELVMRISLSGRTGRAGTGQRFARLRYAAVAALPLLVLGALTVRRARLWHDPLALYQNSVDEAPTNPRAWLNLGAMNVFGHNYDAAFPQLQEAERLYALEESPHAIPRVGAFIHHNLGIITYERKLYADSTVHFFQALRLGASNAGLRPTASLYLGNIAVAEHRWADAVVHYEDAIKTGDLGMRRQTLFYLASAQVRAGQPDQARASLTELLRYEPNNEKASRLLQQIQQ